eukprot:g812.t1
MMDQAAWLLSQVVAQDAKASASCLGISYILIGAILKVGENAIELISTAITPWVFRLLQGQKPFDAKNLIIFALKILCASAVLGTILYPIGALLLWKFNSVTTQTLLFIILIRIFQYNFVNQINDTAVELSRPQWPRTFAGTRLNILGCGPSAKANEDVISAGSYLLLRMFWSIPVAVPFLLLRNIVDARLGMGISVAILNSLLAAYMIYNQETVTKGVVTESTENEEDEISEGKEAKLTPIWALKGFDLTLAFVSAMISACSEAGMTATLDIIVLESPFTILATIMTMIPVPAAILYGIYIFKRFGDISPNAQISVQEVTADGKLEWKVTKHHKETTDVVPREGQNVSGEDDNEMTFEELKENYKLRLGNWSWIIMLTAVCLGLTSCALTLPVFRGNAAVIAAAFIIAMCYPLVYGFNVSFDAFLMNYARFDSQSALDIIFYQNILRVIGVIPVYIVSMLISTSNSEDLVDLPVGAACPLFVTTTSTNNATNVTNITAIADAAIQAENSLERQQAGIILGISVPIFFTISLLLLIMAKIDPTKKTNSSSGGENESLSLFSRLSIHPNKLRARQSSSKNNDKHKMKPQQEIEMMKENENGWKKGEVSFKL